MSNSRILLLFGFLMFLVSIAAIMIAVTINSNQKIEMAKAGLQECVVKNPMGIGVNVIWMKECPK